MPNDGDTASSSEFTYVTRGSRRKKKIGVDNPAGLGLPALFGKARGDLEKTKLWSDCLTYINELPELPPISRALCLGLGSPTTSENALDQLAFLLKLLKHFEINHHAVDIFDPVFCEEDQNGLADLGFVVSKENKEGRHLLDERTLVYMPHCGLTLYENIFRVNWTEDRLSHIVLVGNDPRLYEEITPKSTFEAQTPCIARILPYLIILPFPEESTTSMAFNDFSISYIPSSYKEIASAEEHPSQTQSSRFITNTRRVRRFSDLDDSFWNLPDEKGYQQRKGDPEVVQQEI